MSTLEKIGKWMPALLEATGITLSLTVLAVSCGLVISIFLALGKISKSKVLQRISSAYVFFFRGTPLLVQILIFYFCVGVVVHLDSPYVIGTAALGFFSGAYISEMVRAGVESVDRGQWETALSSGLTRRQALFYVVFPQALRRIVPPVTGQFVSCIKDSSLLSVISVRELTKAAEVVNATTYRTFEAYLPLALLYLLLTWPLSHLTGRLEKGIRNGVASLPR